MTTSAQSGPKNQTRSKMAPAPNSSLTRYFSISVGACALGSNEACADIVLINLNAFNTTGLNMTATNAGVASGTLKTTANGFPINLSGNLRVYNNYNNSGDITTGLAGVYANNSYLDFAITGGLASIEKFGFGSSIGNSSAFDSSGIFTSFKFGSTTASNFTNSDYVGFRFGNTGSYNYGWLQTTWDGTNFQINSGAYESTVNTAILAGAVPVPEPGTLALGSLALLTGGGAAVRRYRKQRSQQATTPAAEPALEGAESVPVS